MTLDVDADLLDDDLSSVADRLDEIHDRADYPRTVGGLADLGEWRKAL